MKKQALNRFEAPIVAANEMFNIQSDEYLDKLVLNNIVVLPLRKLQGNIESKTGKDTVLTVVSGSGSMEVNGSKLPITPGDVLMIKSSEMYVISNDSLTDVLQFVSVYHTK